MLVLEGKGYSWDPTSGGETASREHWRYDLRGARGCQSMQRGNSVQAEALKELEALVVAGDLRMEAGDYQAR